MVAPKMLVVGAADAVPAAVPATPQEPEVVTRRSRASGSGSGILVVGVDRLMTGRTVIAVAHRLSTLRDFDRIVVMQSGRILQDGAPGLLESSPGPYRELLRRQAFHIVGTGQPEAEAA